MNKGEERREDILLRCIRALYPLCVKRAPVLHLTPQDLVDELAVVMLIALIRYRRKRKDDQLRLAYVSARNHMVNMLRNALSNVKRGAGTTHVPMENSDIEPFILPDSRVVDSWMDLRRLAVMFAGQDKAPYLLRAATMDWFSSRLEDEHKQVMAGLETTSRYTVIERLQAFRRELRAKFTASTTSPLVVKQEGVWRVRNASK